METINKIAVLSDLHLDSWNAVLVSDNYNNPLERLVDYYKNDPRHGGKFSDITEWVFAGDIYNGSEAVCSKSDHNGNNIYLTPGNHDYYGRTIDPWIDFFHDKDNAILLSPLWTSFSLPGDPYKRFTSSQVYSVIRDSSAIRGTSVDLMCRLNTDTVKLIELTEPKIIVTHFPPTMKSIGPQYHEDPTNTYFINDLEWLIERHKPELWICGHVHHKHNYYIGNTLVVCNPLGYPRELYKKAVEYVPTIVERDSSGRWSVTN